MLFRLPNEPQLQANGLLDPHEVKAYSDAFFTNVFAGSLIFIGVVTISTLVVAHHLGKEQPDTN